MGRPRRVIDPALPAKPKRVYVRKLTPVQESIVEQPKIVEEPKKRQPYVNRHVREAKLY